MKPSKEERAKFEKVTKSFLRKIKVKGAQAILGGSSAKDTWLSQSHDIDIFVAFDYKEFAKKSNQLSDILEPILRKSFKKVDRLHGSRDYFQIAYQGHDFEVVPILKIEKAEQAINITDVSPLHTEWVNKNAKKLKNEIRKTKALFKANKLYGAESYINGFSGYVLEILTIYYGSFKKLLEAAVKWREKTVIDINKYYPKQMVFFEINKSKLLSPIIVVDPVDKTRNAAAALSLEKFKELKKIAKKYLANPDKSYFVKEELSFEKVSAKNKIVVYLTLTPHEGKKDVIGAKLLKAFNYFRRELEPFTVKKADWDWNIFYFVLAKKELPEIEERRGPPLKLKDFVKDFKKKNKDTFTKGNHIYAKIKVPLPKLQDYVKYLITKKYFREKVLEVKVDMVV
jgi:tRNA nucleotidyltransferase (CCA-adding enzyme)